MKTGYDINTLCEHIKRTLNERFPTQFTADFQIVPHFSQGVSNITFLVSDRFQRMWILRARFGEGLRFVKERWILKNYQDAFPAARLMEDGFVQTEIDGKPLSFIIQSYLGYPTAQSLSYKDEASNLLVDLARICKEINNCGTIGFGKSFIPGQNTFSRLLWSEHINHSLKDLKLDTLAALGYFTFKEQKAFEKKFLELTPVKPTPKLYHSDILKNWGNFLVGPEKEIKAIIDWEFAGSGIGIPEELASALYVLYRDDCEPIIYKYELRRILLGYDISYKSYLLNYQELVELFVTQIAIEKIHRYEATIARGEVLPDYRLKFFNRAKNLVKTQLKKYAEENAPLRVGDNEPFKEAA